jgi:hypothetical protein
MTIIIRYVIFRNSICLKHNVSEAGSYVRLQVFPAELTLNDGLCYVEYINPIGVVAGIRRQTSFIYWALLSRFHLKMEKMKSPKRRFK